MTEVSSIYVLADDRDGQFPANWRMVSEEHRGTEVTVKGTVTPETTCWLVVAEERHYDSENSQGGYSNILGGFITSDDALRMVEMLREAFIAQKEWKKLVNTGPRQNNQWFKDNPAPTKFTGPDGATYSVDQWGWGTSLENVHVIPVKFSDEIKTFDGWWKYTS